MNKAESKAASRPAATFPMVTSVLKPSKMLFLNISAKLIIASLSFVARFAGGHPACKRIPFSSLLSPGLAADGIF